jgi:hypothetical protein
MRKPKDVVDEIEPVAFIRALYDLFFISLVRFQPKARVFAWNLVAANTAGLLEPSRPRSRACTSSE